MQICAVEIFASQGGNKRKMNPRPKRVFGEDLKIFQIPDKFYGPPRGGFTSGYERSSEPMLTRTKDIYYPEYVPRVYIIHTPIGRCVRIFSKRCVCGLAYVHLSRRKEDKHGTRVRLPYNVLEPAV